MAVFVGEFLVGEFSQNNHTLAFAGRGESLLDYSWRLGGFAPLVPLVLRTKTFAQALLEPGIGERL